MSDRLHAAYPPRGTPRNPPTTFGPQGPQGVVGPIGPQGATGGGAGTLVGPFNYWEDTVPTDELPLFYQRPIDGVGPAAQDRTTVALSGMDYVGTGAQGELTSTLSPAPVPTTGEITGATIEYTRAGIIAGNRLAGGITFAIGDVNLVGTGASTWLTDLSPGDVIFTTDDADVPTIIVINAVTADNAATATVAPTRDGTDRSAWRYPAELKARAAIYRIFHGSYGAEPQDRQLLGIVEWTIPTLTGENDAGTLAERAAWINGGEESGVLMSDWSNPRFGLSGDPGTPVVERLHLSTQSGVFNAGTTAIYRKVAEGSLATGGLNVVQGWFLGVELLYPEIDELDLLYSTLTDTVPEVATNETYLWGTDYGGAAIPFQDALGAWAGVSVHLYVTDVPLMAAAIIVDEVSASPASTSTPTTGQELFVLVDTSAAGWAPSGVLTLPLAPVANSIINVEDSGNNASVKPIVIDGNGQLINGSATLPLNVNSAAYRLLYTGSAWRIV